MQKINFITVDSASADWNKVCTHPMQSLEWAHVRSAHGIETVLIEQYKNEILDGVYLITLHNIPFTKYKVAYAPKSRIPDTDVIKKISEFAKENNIIFIKFEPNSLSGNNINVPKEFTLSPHPVFTKHNQLLDLGKSEEELLASFHSKTRYNIKLAEKKGVQVKELSNSEGYKIFEKLYFETCKRQKYKGHTPQYHQKIWDQLSKSAKKENENSLKSKIVVAFYKNIPLAVYQLWRFKDTMYYVYGGSDPKYKEVMAANLLMWESIKLAKKNNCTTFDMWGSLSEDYSKNDPWAGFTRFKQGYGTTFVEYVGSFDFVIIKPLYNIYNIVQFIRQKII